MKIISSIIIGIGLVITLISSLVIFYATHTGVSGVTNSAERGIGDIAWGLSTAYYASFINLFGCAILVLGVLLALVAMFTGRKKQ